MQSSILAGVLCLLLASVLAFPETSLQASTSNMADSLQQLGTLYVKVTNHRIQGRAMPRYDHRQILFATAPVMDEHVRLLMSVDKKCARGERESIIVKSAYVLCNFVCVSYLCNKMHVTVSALLPHLLEEPIWVPGLPCGLFTAQLDMAPQWSPFLTVLVSRLRRIRSSLSAMDSNMRISSDEVTFCPLWSLYKVIFT